MAIWDAQLRRFSEPRPSWHSNLQIWGGPGDCLLEVSTELSRVVDVSARIDVRGDYRAFLRDILRLAAKSEWAVVTVEGQVQDPHLFLDSLAKIDHQTPDA